MCVGNLNIRLEYETKTMQAKHSFLSFIREIRVVMTKIYVLPTYYSVLSRTSKVYRNVHKYGIVALIMIII
jgi:hypothetical protein